ncbi:sigma 54 modulation/S30EA ribosomal C-terminal domain-containing protein [Kribbella sp. NPDC004536]|uniref:sigma 54 modulation/S30EA ribosomal C-terminal domain-containing protein n=1 Tax=Kribbella sp. NPDC004536 TaxID=3364106 RepID=UPI0036C1AB08
MNTAREYALPLRPGIPIPVRTSGIVPTDAAAMIHDHLGPILGALAPQARVRLTRLPEPGLRRPLVAQLDVQLTAGRRIRAQVAAAKMFDLVDQLATRTIGQLRLFPDRLAECLRDRYAGALPPAPPELLPPDRRRVVRRKACVPAATTVAEAIAVLEAMDYRFHLFQEKYSRQDTIVIRTGPRRYRIVQTRPNPIGLEVTSPPITLTAAERCSLPIATARLDLTGGPFAIFTEKQSGRLHALYARDDGHYGLLAPAQGR